MARKTIQKKMTETHVKGYIRNDGKAQSITIVIPGKCKTLEIAEKQARKQNASFMAIDFEVIEATYFMPLQQFLEGAERVINEDKED